MELMEPYFSGEKLYGDDFSPEQLADWYADEQEAYANLGAKDERSYRYIYHARNQFHAYRHLPARDYERVLGFGSAYGDELLPIIERIKSVTIIDPSDAFGRDKVHGVPAHYVKPRPDGTLPFVSSSFDLATCLGVLHHVANVSFVLGEIARTLRPGGHLILREPIISLGDWRKPRRGLTKRERGIPLQLLKAMIANSQLETLRMRFCAFPATPKLFRYWRADVYNSPFATRVDSILSALLSWNVNYHAQTAFQRLRPAAAFFLLRKRALQSDAAVTISKTNQPTLKR